MSNDIWCEIRLGEVAHVIHAYELWKDNCWYHAVGWREVCVAFGELLQTEARNGVVNDIVEKVERVELPFAIDRDGLLSLALEPITVTQVQLTNGGHRLKAMRAQGVRSVPGMFHREDVGKSVRPERIYPLSPE